MAWHKNEEVYLGGLALITLWDIAQMWWVRDNDVLLMFSFMTFAITCYGDWVTVRDDEDAGMWWMLGYTIPAGLIAFGAAQGWFELQNAVLVSAHERPIESPLAGSSRDYIDAAYSHYLSMLAPAGAWVLAHLVPIGARVLARLRA